MLKNFVNFLFKKHKGIFSTSLTPPPSIKRRVVVFTVETKELSFFHTLILYNPYIFAT